MIRHVALKLVTPAMIGGAGKYRSCDDPPVLRPPSVLGMLRFWTRALTDCNVPPRERESRLWGDTERGQGVAIVGAPYLWRTTGGIPLFPHKRPDRKDEHRAESDMVHPGSRDADSFDLRFRLPLWMGEKDLDTLRAVAWTWLHLGSIGRRARRGYGSLLWLPTVEDTDLLAGFVDFDPEEDLASPESLSEYLKKGLGEVRKVLRVPHPKEDREQGDWFRLRTLDQVFVGTKILNEKYDGHKYGNNVREEGMEWLAHGLDPDKRGKDRSEMGGRSRASPMMWRFFPVNGKIGSGFIPILTWSPYGSTCIDPRSDMATDLTCQLGFERSLADKSLTCT